MSNKVKFLNYINTKFEEEMNEYNNKKRKFNNNTNNKKSTSYNSQHSYHITNQ